MVQNPMRMHSKAKYLLGVVALLLVSCSDTPFFEKSYSFPKNEWHEDVKPMFKVVITDTTQYYDFVITLRTTTDYAFSNAWIYLNTKTPDGQSAREPFEIKIANSDGSWVGNKSGTVVENYLSFRRKKLPKKGTYYFTLEQAVTQKTLHEVLDVGLLVNQVKK